jgi:hypothetical protein
MFGAPDGLFSHLVAFGAVAGGPWLFVRGFHAWRVKRLISGTPTSRIRSMAIGLVELNGRVQERSRVTAPFSGRACAYWEVEIATPSSRGRTRGWTTVHHNRSGQPFYLKDDTGTALVYPQGAECHLPFGVEEYTHGLGVPEPYASYMQQQGLTMRAIWSMGPMRFRERTLDDDLVVYVLGRAYPRAMSVNVSWDEEALQATGTDGLGASHVRERDADVKGVVRRGPQDPAFIISPQSEKTMEFMYAVKAFGGLLGGPPITLFGVWCLIELSKAAQLFR